MLVPSPKTLTNMETHLTALLGIRRPLCCKINGVNMEHCSNRVRRAWKPINRDKSH